MLRRRLLPQQRRYQAKRRIGERASLLAVLRSLGRSLLGRRKRGREAGAPSPYPRPVTASKDRGDAERCT